MRNITFLILLFGLMSCGSDDNAGVLRLDGDNFSAPSLESGIHQAAVRFNANDLAAFVGQDLESIDFYLVNLPTSCSVVVYADGGVNGIGAEIYRQDVSNTLRSDNWNTHMLTTPIEIPSSSLTFAIEVRHNERLGSIGCDPGPAVVNGDFYLGNNSNDWTTFRESTNQQVDINWNIRGNVAAL